MKVDTFGNTGSATRTVHVVTPFASGFCASITGITITECEVLERLYNATN
jgi:hypothetical protein